MMPLPLTCRVPCGPNGVDSGIDGVTATTPSSATASVVAAAVGVTNSALAAVGSHVPT